MTAPKLFQTQARGPAPPALQLTGLTKRYGGRAAVEGLTLSVRTGECYGLLGPNGAGKTTTFRMIVGLTRPTSGTILVGGRDVRKDRAAAIRKIGYLPEVMPVDEARSAAGNLYDFGRILGLSKVTLGARVPQLLGRVGLDHADRRRCRVHSKGMRQRLGIARTLLHSPSLLLFDEPSSGLDPIGQREIRALISTLLREDVAVVLATHNLEEARDLCNRVGILARGRIRGEMEIRPVGHGRTIHAFFRIPVSPEARATIQALRGVLRTDHVSPRRMSIVVEPGYASSELSSVLEKLGGGIAEFHDPRTDLQRLYDEAVTSDS